MALQYWRVRSESAVLEATFGDEYRNWKAQTWF
jgi:protein-S-isoprenylcysteine O-methyltransferase Ste14